MDRFGPGPGVPKAACRVEAPDSDDAGRTSAEYFALSGDLDPRDPEPRPAAAYGIVSSGGREATCDGPSADRSNAYTRG